MPSLSQEELDEIYAFAVQLGKEAGKLLLDGVDVRIRGGGRAEEQVEKENAVDIVTETDEST
jgi:myo-inositol-1(or 4)-monophosphatase